MIYYNDFENEYNIKRVIIKKNYFLIIKKIKRHCL